MKNCKINYGNICTLRLWHLFVQENRERRVLVSKTLFFVQIIR